MRVRRPGAWAPATLAVIAVAMLASAGAASSGLDILDCFTPAKQAEISSGRAVVDLAHVQDVDLAIIGAARTTAGGDSLLASFREFEQLHTGPHTAVIRRFSDTPQVADLSGFALDDGDLESLRECRPGRCGIKLSAGEMAAVHRTIRAAGARWKPAVQDAFRELMVDRAREYLTGGIAAAPWLEDHDGAVLPEGELELLLREWRPTIVGMQPPAALLRRDKARHRPVPRESVLFWSTDRYDRGKAVFSITHATLFAGHDDGRPTLVTAVQVYASHYLTASVSLTAIVSAPDSSARYLVYSRRSRVDVFRGTLGGWLRRTVEKRIDTEGPAALDRLRMKLETGTPDPRSSR